MDADKALLRKLTGCQTTDERLDLLIGELDRLGYVETCSYLNATAPELSDGSIDEALDASEAKADRELSDLEDLAEELTDQAGELVDAAEQLRDAMHERPAAEGAESTTDLAAKLAPIMSEMEAGAYDLRRSARELRRAAMLRS